MSDNSPLTLGVLEAGKTNPALMDQIGPYDLMFHRMFSAEALGPDAPRIHCETYSVIDGAFPPSVDACDGWLVTGSKHGVYEDLPWMRRLAAFLREAIAAERPIIGICFGHQMLAHALGGRVEKFSGGWGVGVHRYERAPAAVWEGLETGTLDEASRLSIRAIHQDQVIEPPAGAVTIASSPFCTHAGLAYGDVDHPVAITLQPHPEYEAGAIHGLVSLRKGEVIPDGTADAALASLDQEVDNRPIARWLAAFLARRAAKSAAKGAIGSAAEDSIETTPDRESA